MTPTWGTVQPMGMTSPTLAALQATIPAPYAATPRPYLVSLRLPGAADGVRGLPHRLADQCRGRLRRGGFRPGERRRSPGGAVLERSRRHAAAAGSLAADRRHGCHPGGARSAADRARDSPVGLALDDAGIGAWGIKYEYNAWRPVTAIRIALTGAPTSPPAIHLVVADRASAASRLRRRPSRLQRRRRNRARRCHRHRQRDIHLNLRSPIATAARRPWTASATWSAARSMA